MNSLKKTLTKDDIKKYQINLKNTTNQTIVKDKSISNKNDWTDINHFIECVNFFYLLREPPIEPLSNKLFIKKYTHLFKNHSILINLSYLLKSWSSLWSAFFNNIILIKILIIPTPNSTINNKKSIILLNSFKRSYAKSISLPNQEKIMIHLFLLSNFKSVPIWSNLILINKLQKGKKKNWVNMIKSSVFWNPQKRKLIKSKKNDKIFKNLKINFYILLAVETFISK
mgnify:CR=1 FL=1